MDSKKFYQKLDRVLGIPTLPVVAFKVNKMLQDYDISINELTKTIEKDQAIVSKILRLVNSAFYGFQSKIETVSHAVIVLGFNTVRNAVLSVSVIKAFSGKDSFEGFDIKDFWRHSVGVATVGRHLAGQTRLDNPDDCFIAGLLHDIGKVILSEYFKESFGQVWASVRDDGLSFYEAEKNLLPLNHAQIGGHLAAKWQLPLSLVDTIRYHHAVREGVSNLNQLMIVYVADIIVNTHNVDSGTACDFSNIYPKAAKIMRPQLETVSDWFPPVATEIESACELLLKPELSY